MNVLKFGKTIYGAKLTAAERKALQIEIRKEAAEHDRKFAREVEATFLWIIRQKLGYGEKGLKTIHDEYFTRIKALIDHYELEEEDDIWLCTRLLKAEGIDIEQWEKEDEAKENERNEV